MKEEKSEEEKLCEIAETVCIDDAEQDEDKMRLLAELLTEAFPTDPKSAEIKQLMSKIRQWKDIFDRFYPGVITYIKEGRKPRFEDEMFRSFQWLFKGSRFYEKWFPDLEKYAFYEHFACGPARDRRHKVQRIVIKFYYVLYVLCFMVFVIICSALIKRYFGI